MILIAIAASLILSDCVCAAASAEDLPHGLGRIYVFRGIRSYGGHIDDDVTINGVPVRRVTPGTGFYCDLQPGTYTVGVLRHKTNPKRVSIASGQSQYILISPHIPGGVSPRAGAITPDPSFDVRLLEPDYGAQRSREYHLFSATCK